MTDPSKVLEIMGRWQANPSIGVPLFRELAMRRRGRRAASMTITSVDEDDFRQLATQICGFLIDDGTPAAFRNQCIQEGLHTLYIDILLADTFWGDGQKQLLSHLMSGLTHCIRHIQPNSQAAGVIVQRAPSLLRFLWENRHHFDMNVLDEYGLDMADTLIPEQELLWLILDIYEVYVRRCQSQPPPSTYIPHLCAYIWTSVNRRDLRVAGCFHLITFLSAIEFQAAEAEQFAKNAIVDGVGAKQFIARAYSELKREDQPDVLTVNIAWSVARLSDVPCMQAHIEYRDLLSHFATATSRLATKAESRRQDRDAILTASLEMFNKILVRSARFSGTDAFELLARAIDLLLVEASLTGFNKTNYNAVTQTIRNLAMFVLQLRTNADAVQRPIVTDLENAARLVWWPGLSRLQIAKYRVGQKASYDDVISWWTLLGTNLTLKEGVERKRFKKRSKRHCSWRECQFSKAKVVSGVKLRDCSGCKQARYCGDACQSSDWYKGGHKQLCKRLKEGVHQQ